MVHLPLDNLVTLFFYYNEYMCLSAIISEVWAYAGFQVVVLVVVNSPIISSATTTTT